MLFAEIITELFRRQSRKQADYAKDVLKLTPEHFNKILNGSERGTKKLAELAIDGAGLDWQQVLTLPPDPATMDQAKEATKTLTEALALSDYRDWAIGLTGLLKDRIEKGRETASRAQRYRKKAKRAGKITAVS